MYSLLRAEKIFDIAFVLRVMAQMWYSLQPSRHRGSYPLELMCKGCDDMPKIQVTLPAPGATKSFLFTLKSHDFFNCLQLGVMTAPVSHHGSITFLK